jgi:UDP-N-acetylglucosamine/UDP-N-acetylgalactosamine diphosphorylase
MCVFCTFLQTSGALDDMYQRGIKYLPQYCVDNAVVKVADPVFLGYCIAKGADVGGKAIAKVAWDEKVGVGGVQ